MVGIEKRRVQRTGSSSYIITLPKEWVESVKLKSGDYILVEKFGDKLVLIPPNVEPTQLRINIRVYPGVDVPQVFRSILGAYITGYNIINVVFDKNIPELAKFISDVKNLVRIKLPGIEVVEETYNTITFKVLLNIQEIPLINAIKRLHLIVNSMLQDAIELLKKVQVAYGESTQQVWILNSEGLSVKDCRPMIRLTVHSLAESGALGVRLLWRRRPGRPGVFQKFPDS